MLSRFLQENSGAVAVSAGWLASIFFVLVGGGIEMTHSYWQANAMQHTAKTGVRIAVTTSPVALELTSMTGMEGGADVGDPLPDYKIVCSGKTLSCNRGGFDLVAFNKIFYGRDNDAVCANNELGRRGMCDLFSGLKPENVTIIYEDSGMGRAGNPPDLFPIVTVSISDVQKDYVFLDFLGDHKMGARASAIGEDLK